MLQLEYNLFIEDTIVYGFFFVLYVNDLLQSKTKSFLNPYIEIQIYPVKKDFHFLWS